MAIFPALLHTLQVTLRACFGARILTLHHTQVGRTRKSKFVTTRQLYVFFVRTSATVFVTGFLTQMSLRTAYVVFSTLSFALELKLRLQNVIYKERIHKIPIA